MDRTNPYMQRLFYALVYDRRVPFGTCLEGFRGESHFYFETLPSVYTDRYLFHIITLECDHDSMYR